MAWKKLPEPLPGDFLKSGMRLRVGGKEVLVGDINRLQGKCDCCTMDLDGAEYAEEIAQATQRAELAELGHMVNAMQCYAPNPCGDGHLCIHHQIARYALSATAVAGQFRKALLEIRDATHKNAVTLRGMADHALGSK